MVRAYRNTRLTKSFTGILMIYLYYAHSEEMAQIVAAHPALAAKAGTLARELAPALQAGLKNNAAIAISGKQFKMITALLSEMRGHASPRLHITLDSVLKKLRSPEHLKKLGIVVRN